MPVPNQGNNGSSPTVAVIIPCHNHGDYIQEAIASVTEQDYPNKCLAIVDDASTDDSATRIKSLFSDVQKEYLASPGITITAGLIHGLPAVFAKLEENRKRAGARNVALNIVWSSADYFCPLDADDKFLPGKLSKSMEVMLGDPKNIGLVYADDIIYNVNSKTTVHQFRPPFDRRHLEFENYICNCPLISKEALGYAGAYDESLELCEDWDLWLRITEYFNAIHIPDPLSQYTETGDNCTFTYTDEKWNELRTMVYGKMLARRKQNYGF
jgi:glycosyltransferase involved in cell wall biosynthesis